ncbi:helix-turn-helix domain-containing protein [Halocatena halophila]|uniref:helix-turn-helix domain-containing protein n=1 Tax=Halocatena halophila TaxID=2814576 RepID=UPI002ED37A2E
MRFATIVHKHSDGWFQSLGATFSERNDVTPIALHSSQILTDGTAVVLYELEGAPETVRSILEKSQTATDFRVTQKRDNIIAYIHFEPTPVVAGMLKSPATYGLLVDGPITFHDDGGVELSLIGREEDIQRALAETPEHVATTIKRVGQYAPGQLETVATLSERQREVLRMAHKQGYYEQPRQATYDDIATQLGCTKANVGDILRRIENALINEIVQDRFEHPTVEDESRNRT